MAPDAQERLDGWKSIAGYLKRTTRTVQRWEKLEGLPVHRIGHTSSASVFAYPAELDQWWNERKSRIDDLPESPGSSSHTAAGPLSLPFSRTLLVAALALLGVLAVGAFAFYLRTTKLVPPFTRADVTTPVSPGNVELAALSPDGKSLVYAWDVDKQHTLTLRDLSTGEEKTLAQGNFSRYYGLTFTRDGKALYFTARNQAGVSALYRMPLTLGSAVEILKPIDSPVTFSPDGKQIAYVREAGESQLVIAQADGSGQKPIASRKLPDYLDYPAWSPDGSVIVAGSRNRDGARLIAVDPVTGTERPVGGQTWDFLRFPVWLDGNTLAASLRATRLSTERLYRISYPDGEAGILNLPGDRFLTLSASFDGRSLAGVMRVEASSVLTADRSGEPRQIMAPVVGARGIGWSESGRLLFGPRELSSIKPDGTGLARVRSGIEFSSFAVCGAQDVVYTLPGPSNEGLWLATLPGGTPRRLLAHNTEGKPQCSPDRKWVVYSGRWSPAYQIPTAGGAEQMLIADAVLSPAVSWDNQWIAAYRIRNAGATTAPPQEIAIYPRTGGPAAKAIPIQPAGEFNWTPLRWSPDNTAIGYVEEQAGVANLWLQPVDGTPRRQLTHFQGGRVTDFEWSKDGQLAIELTTVVRDVFLVRDGGTQP
ncbi:MAG: hypothetical protein ABI972_03405 [Acidobacteriota bacterium]